MSGDHSSSDRGRRERTRAGDHHFAVKHRHALFKLMHLLCKNPTNQGKFENEMQKMSTSSSVLSTANHKQ
jgi:hypothetical protein